MNAPQKIVPTSKLSEWKGLDRINSVVHGMGCIWRVQETDDIGVDGEIELLRPRDDGGGGMVGTGKIVKAQSKSGSSYVVRDQEDSFASPVTEKDLRYWRSLNVPIVYIVFHPKDDLLYWKDVKSYLSGKPDAFKPPLRIEFNKATDRFDESAYPALCALCEEAPGRISTDVAEPLHANLLTLVTLPERVWITPVLPEKQPRFHDRLTGAGIIPPYAYKSGTVVTLADPTLEETALSAVIDPGSTEEHSLEDWLSQDFDFEDDFRTLLNGIFHRHLRSIGLDYQKKPRRYFYRRGLAQDAPLRQKWTNARTGRTQPRNVAKHYVFGKNRFYLHHALNFRVERFGPYWAYIIDPTLHYTLDGVRPWTGDEAKSYAIRARAEQYNDVYLRDVFFWAHQISGGADIFDLKVGNEVIAQVQATPQATSAPFSIRSSPPASKKKA